MHDIALRLSRRAANFLNRYDSLRNNQLHEFEEALDIVEELQICSHLLITIIALSFIIPSHDNIGHPQQAIIDFMEEATLTELGWLLCLSDLLVLEVEDAVCFSIGGRPTPTERFLPIRNKNIDPFDDETADDFLAIQ